MFQYLNVWYAYCFYNSKYTLLAILEDLSKYSYSNTIESFFINWKKWIPILRTIYYLNRCCVIDFYWGKWALNNNRMKTRREYSCQGKIYRNNGRHFLSINSKNTLHLSPNEIINEFEILHWQYSLNSNSIFILDLILFYEFISVLVYASSNTSRSNNLIINCFMTMK